MAAGLSYEEIALVLDITPDEVRLIEITALRKLRRVFIHGLPPTVVSDSSRACDDSDLGNCHGPIAELACEQCNFSTARCEHHGGARAAGGGMSGHRRAFHPRGDQP